jgi:transcriptional regulator GlxA family with amidase domain
VTNGCGIERSRFPPRLAQLRSAGPEPASRCRTPPAISRSALADRFIRLIGLPPMHYLASWRMQVATQKLRNTNASLAQVAEIVGYDSEAAFSRAFKKAFGLAPATWRRANR